MTLKSLALIAALALLTSLAAGAAFADSRDVDLTAADGITLKATYTAPDQPGPGMLLVHQCNMDRTMWADITDSLVAAGIHVLTLDLRGFGDSEGEGLGGEGGFQAFMKASAGDVDEAYKFLNRQPGVDGSRIGMGGASCGAMLTAGLASDKTGVDALILLSGPPSPGAAANIVASPDMAVFAAAATGDTIIPGVADRLQSAVDGSRHEDSIAMIYPGTEHGYPLFAVHPDLQPKLLAWLKEQLLGE